MVLISVGGSRSGVASDADQRREREALRKKRSSECNVVVIVAEIVANQEDTAQDAIAFSQSHSAFHLILLCVSESLC
jgi:hypothetical protein